MLSISLLSKIRPVYHTRGLAYVRIQAVGVTNCRIKKGVTNCHIKKMVEHTDNQKKRENAENKTAFYYIRYRQANVSRISALTFCLEIVIASKSLVRLFSIFFVTDDDDDDRETNRLLNPARAYAARGNDKHSLVLLGTTH